MRHLATHLQARIRARAPSDYKTAAHLNARAAVQRNNQADSSPVEPSTGDQVIVRSYNLDSQVGWDGSFLYPRESPLNFTPLRKLDSNLPGALDRVVRETPWESKTDILSSRLVRPEFASETNGTPRREYQGGMVDGIRVRSVTNPYFKPHGAELKQYDRWRSRHFERWDPLAVAVRGGTRLYKVPEDILPKKDELGQWTDPTLSGRYQADIKRQYTMHGLPWIYKRDFLEHKMHILDKEPIGPKRWYKREYRQAKIREAMRNMDSMVAEYRKERQAAKKKTWFEQIVQKLVGNQVASKYIVERKVPKA